MNELFAAIAIILILEGVAYGAFPDFMKRAAFEISRTDPEMIRIVGLSAALLGVVVLWLVHG